MIFVVSGEGPSDMGECANATGECSYNDFTRGPMAVVIERLADTTAGFDFAHESLEFVSEARRCEVAKNDVQRSYIAGKKRGFEEAYFFKEARALALLAKKKKLERQCPVAAVLFRDADGTRSTERGLFETKLKSINDGFEAEDFELGVPMVPKPKSEAWLICALKRDRYQNCSSLEERLSGNDNAPNSAKTELEALLTARRKTPSELADMVADGTIDPLQISMPSFTTFRNRLEYVTNRMLGRPTTATSAGTP